MLGLAVKIALSGRLRTLCYVERDSYAAATLVARMEDETLDNAPIWDDVTSITGAEFSAFMDSAPRPLCVTAGYPCQPFSQAGKRAGKNDERYIWHYIAAFIERNSPELCFFENVPGHLRLGFDTVHRDLERLGYSVAAGLFTASETGASHQRKRLFILGYSEHGQWHARRTQTEWPPRFGCAISGSFMGHTGNLGTNNQNALRQLADTESPFPAHSQHSQNNTLANADRERCQWSVTAGNSKAYGFTAECDGILLFAPAPDDAAAWEKVLSIKHGVKPSVRRDANGLANRVDRLRLTGNGVSTLAASYAFVSLASALCFQHVG